MVVFNNENTNSVSQPCAAICAIGNELTTGKVKDSNGYFLSQELTELGIHVNEIIQINDNVKSMLYHIERLISENDILIITGGLGPTDDDLTVDVLCSYFQVEAEYDEYAKKKAMVFFERGYKKKIPPAEYDSFLQKSLKQTRKPSNSTGLKNEKGMAPGIFIEFKKEGKEKKIFSFPGFPDELQNLWQKAKPILQKDDHLLSIRYFNLWTIPESKAFHEILYNKKFLELGDRSLPFGCQIYLKNNHPKNEEAMVEFEKTIKFIEEKYKEVLYNDPIVDFLEFLKNKNKSIATVESCTGGLAAKLITDNAGVSSVYKGSVIAYDNQVKENLMRVKRETLEKFGVVSKETAKELAANAIEILNVDYSISFTGIAGPSGGTDKKPIGLVFISIAKKNVEPLVYEFHFNYGRDRFRMATVYQGFLLLCHNFLKEQTILGNTL